MEKPNLDRALEYLNSGHYRWNAGMFLWSFLTVTQGLQTHAPDLFEASELDGASRWQQFRYIILPGITPIAHTGMENPKRSTWAASSRRPAGTGPSPPIRC